MRPALTVPVILARTLQQHKEPFIAEFHLLTKQNHGRHVPCQGQTCHLLHRITRPDQQRLNRLVALVMLSSYTQLFLFFAHLLYYIEFFFINALQYILNVNSQLCAHYRYTNSILSLILCVCVEKMV